MYIMRGMQQLNSNIPSNGAIRIAGITTVLKRCLRRIRLAPRPRYSLSLALLMSILQNSPVADTRHHISIQASISPKLAQEIAGSGARDEHGQKHLLHRICTPHRLGSLQASAHQFDTSEITKDTGHSAEEACGGQNAYLLKTPIHAGMSTSTLHLTWVSI